MIVFIPEIKSNAHLLLFQKDYAISRQLFYFSNYGLGGTRTNEFSAAAASNILLQYFCI